MGEEHRTYHWGGRRRTTVAEAAEALGISVEAVRGRIRRGTLPVEREGGKVYVLLEPGVEDRTTTDQPRTTTERPDDLTDALIASLEGQIEDLREQVRSERQAHAEARRLLAAALERIPPQVEPPNQEAPTESTEGAEEMPMGPTPSEARGYAVTEQPGQRVEPQHSIDAADEVERAGRAPSESAMGGESLRRPWWRRVFGG